MSSIFRKKFDHTPQRVKRARKICLFLSKKRKELVASVVTNEHDEIIDKAIEKLLTHVQFKYYPERLKFLQDLDQKFLLQCARNMVLVYQELLRHYCRYLQLQREEYKYHEVVSMSLLQTIQARCSNNKSACCS